MKKIKLLELLLLLLVFIVILSIVLQRPINDLDELWNYNFARNIADGLIPYKDFNMVITPLLAIISGIILKLTINQLIVMRILAALLCAGIIWVAYKLFELLKINKNISIIFCFLIGYLLKDCYCMDYNFATLLIVLIMIYLEIKTYKQDNIFFNTNIKIDLLLGILAGLTFTLKQTSGILICVALLGNKLLFVRNKVEFKIYLKDFLYRLLGILIPSVSMFVYLTANHAFDDFISYTIKGVLGFNNIISYESLIKFDIIGLLAILVPITMIGTWYRCVIKEKCKERYLLLVYGMANFVITFPISNKIHFLIGAMPIIILILYELYSICKILYNKFLKDKYSFINKMLLFIIYFITIFVILFLIVYCIKNVYHYLSLHKEYSNLEHYEYIPINKYLEKEIKEINQYILKSQKEVIILDATAVTYMIPINQYHKDYDLFNKGNLGFNGEDRIIRDISQSTNIKYLILKDQYNKNWQTPLDIIDFVKNNKRKVGEIKIFDIYQ